MLSHPILLLYSFYTQASVIGLQHPTLTFTLVVSYYNNVVCVYDSGRPSGIHSDITRNICSFFKCKEDVLRLDLMNVVPQPNANDCGIHAVAYATELAYGADPVVCSWDMPNMRQHLIHCFESGVLTQFPKIGKRRIRCGT